MQTYKISQRKVNLQTDFMFLIEITLENATSASKTSNLIIINLAIYKIHRLGNVFNWKTEISQHFWAKYEASLNLLLRKRFIEKQK